MEIIKKIAEKQKDINAAKPVTLAFLGDSVTQGCFECYTINKDNIDTVFDAKSAYSTRIKEILNILYPTVQINIINSGISGDNAVNGLKRLDRDVLSFNPDLVVLGFALNDSTFGEQGLSDYENAIESIIKRVKEFGAEVILLTPNMMNTLTSPHLKEELFINLSKGFKEIQDNGMLTKYVNAEKSVANRLGINICDMYDKWLKMSESGVNTTELLANKLNHPIREMHYYTAIELIETMFK